MAEAIAAQLNVMSQTRRRSVRGGKPNHATYRSTKEARVSLHLVHGERLAHARAEQFKTVNRLVGEDEADVLRAVRLAPARHCGRTNAMMKEAARHRIAIDAEIFEPEKVRPGAVGDRSHPIYTAAEADVA